MFDLVVDGLYVGDAYTVLVVDPAGRFPQHVAEQLELRHGVHGRRTGNSAAVDARRHEVGTSWRRHHADCVRRQNQTGALRLWL